MCRIIPIPTFRTIPAICIIPTFRRIPLTFASSLAALLLLCVAPSRARQADANRFELRGVVINSVTGETVSRALVQLNLAEGKMQLSGPDGVFVFTNVPRGQYLVTAMKPGFFNEQDLGNRTAAINSIKNVPSDENAELKLIPEGVIYGEVKNENGEPIEGAAVKALRSRVVSGQRVIEHTAETITNDEGSFRIADLKPGAYRLSFSAASAGVVFLREVGQKRDSELGYASEFYPGVADADSATAIHVAAGAQVHITQALKRQKLFDVAGVVRGADPDTPFNVMLRDASGDYVPRSLRIDAKRGQFQIIGVQEGTYLLAARAAGPGGFAGGPEVNRSMLGATQWIHVNSDLTSLVLTLSRVNSLEVRLRDEIPPNGTNAVHRVRVQLMSKEFVQYSPATVAGGAEGEPFAGRIDDVLPGTYTVEAAGFSLGYVASLRCGDADLLREDLTVAPGTDLPLLEATLRNDGAQLSVSVVAEDRRTAGGVVIYSEEFPRRSVVVPMNGASGFTQENLAPGRYLVIAVEDAEELEFHNPARMAKYLGQATEVVLQPGDKTSIRVELQTVQEQQP